MFQNSTTKYNSICKHIETTKIKWTISFKTPWPAFLCFINKVLLESRTKDKRPERSRWKRSARKSRRETKGGRLDKPKGKRRESLVFKNQSLMISLELLEMRSITSKWRYMMSEIAKLPMMESSSLVVSLLSSVLPSQSLSTTSKLTHLRKDLCSPRTWFCNISPIYSQEMIALTQRTSFSSTFPRVLSRFRLVVILLSIRSSRFAWISRTMPILVLISSLSPQKISWSTTRSSPQSMRPSARLQLRNQRISKKFLRIRTRQKRLLQRTRLLRNLTKSWLKWNQRSPYNIRMSPKLTTKVKSRHLLNSVTTESQDLLKQLPQELVVQPKKELLQSRNNSIQVNYRLKFQ